MSRSRYRRHANSPPQPLVLIITALALVTGVVVWNELGAVRNLAAQQRQLSQLAVTLVGEQLAQTLLHTARMNELLLEGRFGPVTPLAPPEDPRSGRLGELLDAVHPDYLGFVLADNQGGILHQEPADTLADQLAPRLSRFAAGKPHLVIRLQAHRAQLEMLQRVALPGGDIRILMSRFKVAAVAELLARGTVTGTQLLLIVPEQPVQVPAATGKGPATIQQRPALSADERDLVSRRGATGPVPNTDWQLMALPDAETVKRTVRAAWLHISAMVATALLFTFFAMWRMREEAKRREQAEAELLRAQADLERKVKKRTLALTNANRALAAQIERRQKAEKRMTMLSRAVEHTGDSIIVTDRDGTIAYANPAFARLTGRHTNEVIGTSLADLQTAHQPSEFMRRLWAHLDSENGFREIFCIRDANGEPCYTEQTITPLRNRRGEITRLIATGKDITERMDSEKRLSFLAHHDTLTGLPNRALMFDRLDHALARANRKGTMVALLFMDIDRFKTINDSLGHQAGDELLIAVSERLGNSVRRSDSIARLGGDEFVAILEDIRHTDEPVHVANTILTAIAQPLTLTGNEVSVTSSMGIALFPEDGGDANVLLQCADAAMYKAKAQGGNTYNFYTADMTEEAQRRLNMENRLRNALEKDEFRLLYQPRLDLSSNRVTAVEALLRWQPADAQMQTPADFMTVLEETGLIRKVGEWVLQQVCNDFVRIQSAGHHVRMACNLSAKQFGDQELVDMIDRTVLNQAMRPEDLELELTESLLAKDADHAADVLAALHDRGVRISVDDFGTGYSSLTYLKRFPIDDLKVDSSFIQHLNDNKDDATIVSAIISLAHSLGLGAVAEGVETQAQLQTLALLGCDEIQGMLVSEPLNIGALLDWLDARDR